MAKKLEISELLTWFSALSESWQCVPNLSLFESHLVQRTLEMLYVLADLQVDELALQVLLCNELALSPPSEGYELQENMQLLHSLCELSDLQIRSSESLRKMLLAMTKDIRAVVMMLARQVVLMRHIRDLNENEQTNIINMTSKLFAPLANRLGLAYLKWELEDLSLRYYHPDIYKQLAKQLDERRVDRERYIREVIEKVSQLLVKHQVRGVVTGRVKHLYSIWRKMENKGRTLDELFDIRAIRILVDSIPDCYLALGLVHEIWQPITKEFDDYIAHPKLNGYQSLHTAVVGPEQRTLEIQIRTHDMHTHAELGVAAHWRYKEGNQAEDQQQQLNFLRKVLENQQIDESVESISDMSGTVFANHVYVLTPKGEAIELIAGATPLDFAYQIHTNLGHRCRGAKVNGRIVPLTSTLHNGDRVEVLTTKLPAPSRDWLSPHLGYLQSSRARAKVRAWFKQQDADKNQLAGKQLLDKEFQRLEIQEIQDMRQRLAHQLNFPSVNELHIALGAGDITLNQVLARLPEDQRKLVPALRQKTPPKREIKDSIDTDKGLYINGMENCLTTIATCCKPVPPELIGGFLTLNRGVSIHRAQCVNFLHLVTRHPERRVDVDWIVNTQQAFGVDVRIDAEKEGDLLKELTAILSNERLKIIELKMQPNADQMTVLLSVEIMHLSQLSRLLDRFNALSQVIEARRVG